MSNGTDMSSNNSNRLPSAGDALRRVSSTGKANQLNSDRANVNSTAPSGIQRQSSTVRKSFRKISQITPSPSFLATIRK